MLHFINLCAGLNASGEISSEQRLTNDSKVKVPVLLIVSPASSMQSEVDDSSMQQLEATVIYTFCAEGSSHRDRLL